MQGSQVLYDCVKHVQEEKQLYIAIKRLHEITIIDNGYSFDNMNSIDEQISQKDDDQSN